MYNVQFINKVDNDVDFETTTDDVWTELIDFINDLLHDDGEQIDPTDAKSIDTLNKILEMNDYEMIVSRI
jgi:hypothetical protein